jgi:MYXO-CTERM domain-containing protein
MPLRTHTTQAFARPTIVAALLAALAVTGGARADDDTRSGVNGANGSNGTPAAPDGGAATDGGNAAATAGGNPATAQGTGGIGGNGGNGARPDAIRVGGVGGAGGAGGVGQGTATSPGGRASATGTGGNAGDGGNAGNGYFPGGIFLGQPGGIGGDGGRGGDGIAVASGRAAAASATAGNGGGGGRAGIGGSTSAPGGTGGRGTIGGTAQADATASGAAAAGDFIISSAVARAGNGGIVGDRGSTAGNGGDLGAQAGAGGVAFADANSTCTDAGTAQAFANSFGGNAGIARNRAGRESRGGAATSFARAISDGPAFVEAHATGGRGSLTRLGGSVVGPAGQGRARGEATGSNGRIITTSSSAGARTRVGAGANADVWGRALSDSRTADREALPAMADLGTVQSGAFAVADPITTDVTAFRAAAPNAGAALHLGEHANTFGLAALGGVRGASSGAGPLDQSFGASFAVDTAQLTTLDGLGLGFGMARSLVHGFSQLSLTLSASGLVPVTLTFTDPQSAAATLSDYYFPLTGAVPDSDGTLTVSIQAQMRCADQNDGFVIGVVASSVPAPSTGVLALFGLAALGRRRRRHPAA